MAFDRKNIQSTKETSATSADQNEKDDLKEFISREESKENLSEEAENEQKRKEALTERD